MLPLNYLFIFHCIFFVFVVIAVIIFNSFLFIYLYLKGLFGLKIANSGFGLKVWVKGLALIATFERKPEIRHVA